VQGLVINPPRGWSRVEIDGQPTPINVDDVGILWQVLSTDGLTLRWFASKSTSDSHGAGVVAGAMNQSSQLWNVVDASCVSSEVFAGVI
jgi:hypothetical protein